MHSFLYDNGALVPFDAQSRERIFIPSPTRANLRPIAPRNSAERRRWARSRTRGRRGARPVMEPQPWPAFGPLPDVIELRAHMLRDGHGREALLYLLAGDHPTDEQCADVDRALRCL